MKDILNIPFGKGETKVLFKKEIWRNGRTDGTKILTRKRFDHTGLKKTMFLLGNSQSDKSSECKTTECRTYRPPLQCRKFREERMILNQKISKAGRKWNLEGS